MAQRKMEKVNETDGVLDVLVQPFRLDLTPWALRRNGLLKINMRAMNARSRMHCLIIIYRPVPKPGDCSAAIKDLYLYGNRIEEKPYGRPAGTFQFENIVPWKSGLRGTLYASEYTDVDIGTLTNSCRSEVYPSSNACCSCMLSPGFSIWEGRCNHEV